MKQLILNKKDKSVVQAELKLLDVNYIDKIIELQNKIYTDLENKDLFVCSSREEFETAISKKGAILGCISLEDNELIAIGVYIEYGYNEHNYGYDLKIKGEELLKVGQIEATVVLEKYRGNKLQKIICESLEEISRSSRMNCICATVAPNNQYSLNTFKKLGYKIMEDKLKYGGLRRYILMKNLKNIV